MFRRAVANPKNMATTMRLCGFVSPKQSVGRPLSTLGGNFVNAAKIEGDKSQKLTVRLLPGQSFLAASHTVTNSLGCCGKTITSSWTDHEIDEWTNNGSDGNTPASLALSSTFGNENTPCTIERVDLSDHSNEILCEYGGFLCAFGHTEVDEQSFPSSSLLFGFRMQRFTGTGSVFLRGNGLKRLRLAEGEVVTFCTDQMVAFAKGTKHEFTQVKHKNFRLLSLTASDYKYMVTLTGPGTAWKQDALSVWQENTWAREEWLSHHPQSGTDWSWGYFSVGFLLGMVMF